MKILIIHNNYSVKGGEESVVEQQRELFTSRGDSVHMYIRSYDEIKSWKMGKIRSLLTSLRNRKAVRDIEEIVIREGIEVAFIHNLYPIISPAILPRLKRLGVKIIFFAHNYRVICPTGLFFDGKERCERCGSRCRELSCTIKRCEGSLLGSIAYTLRAANARIGGYYNNIDTIVALTEFQKRKLTHYGFPKEKIAIIGNFTSLSNSSTDIKDAKRESKSVLFVGRLSREKGYDILFKAAKMLPDYSFTVAGEKSDTVSESELPSNISLLGRVERSELTTLYNTHNTLAITSRCYEGFPLTILEAASHNIPIVAPDMGAMASIIEDMETGVLYEEESHTSLAAKIEMLESSPELREKIAINNKLLCEKEYTKEMYYKKIQALL